MSTRSTIGFYKGNEVRYIYVQHDGFDHGATLENIGHDACELLWNQIGEAEARGERIWLSHLFDDSFDMSGTDYVQPTRRTPLPVKGHWNDDYLTRFGYEFSGVIKVETGWNLRMSPRSIMQLYNMDGNAWLYDLETDKVFFLTDNEGLPANELKTNHPVESRLPWGETYFEF